MAKIETLETLSTGYYNKDKLNQNFQRIMDAFQNCVSLDASTPNFMTAEFDIADANITNVNQLYLNELIIGTTTFAGFSNHYVGKLAALSCSTGGMITHENGDPVCVEPGTDGQVLKVSTGMPVWAADIDTDTVGVTVQEDGVTVAENVTTIDFKWTNAAYPTLVTTPAGNQVDIALDDVYTSTITALWQDTRSTDNLNINPDGPSATIFANVAEVNRLDLVNDVGISVPTSHSEYYVIAETSNLIEDSSGPPPAVGYWTLGVRFYDATGTSTPLTGVQLNPPATDTGYDTRQGSTDGGNLLTVYCAIPANTRYIDFAHADTALFPLFITYASIDNRYRAVVSAAAKNADFQSPNNISYPGGVNPSVTVKP